ncbi:MAG: hypothetical protein EOP10_32010, partial [Proteobacteria bacterium]
MNTSEDSLKLRSQLDCLYEATLCLNSLQSVEKSLPDLISLLRPLVRIRVAVLIESQESLHETSWRDDTISDSDFMRAKSEAASRFRYLSGDSLIAGDFYEANLGEPDSIDLHLRSITIPLMVDRSPIFGVLYINCEELSETNITLMHAIGGHIS